MSEQDLQRRLEEFFTSNEAGQMLKARWDERVNRLRSELVWEDDEQKKTTIQAMLRYHEKVLGPELSKLAE